MGSGFYSPLREILLANQCFFVRQERAAMKYGEAQFSNMQFSVPVTVASKNTANAILKQAGIDARL
jgi:hypothetical protein